MLALGAILLGICLGSPPSGWAAIPKAHTTVGYDPELVVPELVSPELTAEQVEQTLQRAQHEQKQKRPKRAGYFDLNTSLAVETPLPQDQQSDDRTVQGEETEQLDDGT